MKMMKNRLQDDDRCVEYENENEHEKYSALHGLPPSGAPSLSFFAAPANYNSVAN